MIKVEVNQQGVSTNICWYLLQFIILTRLWTCTFLLPYIYMYWYMLTVSLALYFRRLGLNVVCSGQEILGLICQE